MQFCVLSLHGSGLFSNFVTGSKRGSGDGS